MLSYQKANAPKLDERNLHPEKWPNLNTFATFVFFIQLIFLALTTILEDSLVPS